MEINFILIIKYFFVNFEIFWKYHFPNIFSIWVTSILFHLFFAAKEGIKRRVFLLYCRHMYKSSSSEESVHSQILTTEKKLRNLPII